MTLRVCDLQSEGGFEVHGTSNAIIFDGCQPSVQQCNVCDVSSKSSRVYHRFGIFFMKYEEFSFVVSHHSMKKRDPWPEVILKLLKIRLYNIF